MQVTELFESPLSLESTLQRTAPPAGVARSSSTLHNSHTIRRIISPKTFFAKIIVSAQLRKRPTDYLRVQSSVRKGPAGSPAPFTRLQSGLLAHA